MSMLHVAGPLWEWGMPLEYLLELSGNLNGWRGLLLAALKPLRARLARMHLFAVILSYHANYLPLCVCK